ncbi:hypothetical protein L0F63_006337 [Massospora cicadina]|nr:hypothetical protein L0F63_006337 [Massospora cicadina]
MRVFAKLNTEKDIMQAGHLFDFTSCSGNGDASPLEELDNGAAKLNQALRSLNTLEFEMPAKASTPRALTDQSQRMVKSIHLIAADAEAVSRHLESWCSPDTSQCIVPSPPQSPDPLPLPPPIFQDCAPEDPGKLLSQKEEVFEGDPLPPIAPLSLEERRARRQTLHSDHQLKRDRQASFVTMAQELNKAIRTHAQIRAAKRLE